MTDEESTVWGFIAGVFFGGIVTAIIVASKKKKIERTSGLSGPRKIRITGTKQTKLEEISKEDPEKIPGDKLFESITGKPSGNKIGGITAEQYAKSVSVPIDKVTTVSGN